MLVEETHMSMNCESDVIELIAKKSMYMYLMNPKVIKHSELWMFKYGWTGLVQPMIIVTLSDQLTVNTINFCFNGVII